MLSDYSDGRKNDRRLSTRAELYDQLVDNINKFLSEEDKKNIKQHPTYYNAILEKNLTTQLTNELATLLREIYHSDPVLRYQLMIETIYHLHGLNKFITEQNVRAESTRMVYAHDLDQLSDAIYQKGIFGASELDEFLTYYFAFKINGKDYEYINEDEMLSIPALFLAKQLYSITIKSDNEISKIIDEVETTIQNQKEFKRLMDKVNRIFSPDDAVEARLLKKINKMLLIEYMRPYVSPDDYNTAVRFTEECIKKDKYELLNEVIGVGRRAMSDEEIKKIMEIKDRQTE
jgi:hypothetical protein